MCLISIRCVVVLVIESIIFHVVFLTASQFWHHLLNKIFWQNKMLFRPTIPSFFQLETWNTHIYFLAWQGHWWGFINRNYELWPPSYFLWMFSLLPKDLISDFYLCCRHGHPQVSCRLLYKSVLLLVFGLILSERMNGVDSLGSNQECRIGYRHSHSRVS